MLHRKGLILICLVIAVLLATGIWVRAPRPVQYVSPTGYVTTLEGYHFTTNKVRYEFPKGFSFRKLLPYRLKRDFVRYGSAEPERPGEPILSCAMAVRIPDGKQGFTGRRLVVEDERGNEYDPVGQNAGNNGNNPTLEVFTIPSFPRRSDKLKLKLKAASETVAEFEIPNPARGEYPDWNANVLPASATTGDLQVRLTEFVSERAMEYSGRVFPNTRCVFEIVQRGQVTTNWVPVQAEFSDATGNRWNPGWFRDRLKYGEEKLTVVFYGALWAEEKAWKIKVDFRQTASFAEGELLRMEGLEVPTGVGVTRPGSVHEQSDGRVELLGLFGPRADRDKAQDIFLNINPRPDAVTIALKLQLAEHERAFALVEISDENGRPQEILQIDDGPVSTEDERWVPLLVYFKPAPGVRKVSLVFAVPKIRQVEFLAKPVQK